MGRKIIAIRECASGNESIGTEWSETAIFDADQPIEAVFEWASTIQHWGKGRLVLTEPTYSPPSKAE